MAEERRYSNISLPAGTLKTVAFDIIPRNSHCLMEEDMGRCFHRLMYRGRAWSEDILNWLCFGHSRRQPDSDRLLDIMILWLFCNLLLDQDMLRGRQTLHSLASTLQRAKISTLRLRSDRPSSVYWIWVLRFHLVRAPSWSIPSSFPTNNGRDLLVHSPKMKTTSGIL
jgi:hypothetical protein